MKGIFASIGGLFFLFTFCPTTSVAQDPAPKTINGGVLNGKAVSLPKPAYPTEAREAKAEGSVAVDIIIDETGSVTSATAQLQDQSVPKSEDGTWQEVREVHPALREAAEEAARSARFSPTLLSGEPVKVKGRVVYNFVVGSKQVLATQRAISGGILNGKAANLPTPEYPAAAVAVRAEGTVTVQIVINEKGEVESATAVSGHPLLRAAAVAAAKEATFAPTRLSGEPVKVSGVLTYNFVAP